MEITNEIILKHIDDAKNGCQSAFNFLLNYYWSEVYGFQLKRVENEYEAEDITIETFAKAFDKISTFKTNYKFSTWLITISKNIHIDRVRKQKKTIASTSVNKEDHKIIDQEPTPEDKLITKQNLNELLEHIKQLKPDYQKIIHLRFFQEMTYKEISSTLNEPITNVKVKLLRAKKLLSKIITHKNNSFD